MARRYSSSAADAEDAYQRALEKLFSVAPEIDTKDLLLSWLLTVVRNEALMIGRSQSRLVAVPYDELAESWSDDGTTPEDRAIDRQELEEGREALLRINPEQARCLLLRAEGLTYDEIAEATGFSYAKVHRALTEGRRMYRGLLGRIESGAECRRVAPLISLLVDDEIGETDRTDIELHLKNCANCRATRREFTLAPQQLASAFPVAAALSKSGGLLQQVFDHVQSAAAWVNERVFSHVSVGPAAEMTVAKKLALVSAVSASVVAGGATVEQFAGSDRPAVGPIAPEHPTAPPPDIEAPDELRPVDRPDSTKRDKSAERDKPRAATESDVVETQANLPRERATAPAPRNEGQQQEQPEPFVELPDDYVDEPALAE